MSLTAARPAFAQWYFEGFAGASHTASADVSVTVPASGLDVTFHDVAFSGHSFQQPPFVGARLGRILGAGGKLAIEADITHLKIFSDTARTYAASGSVSGAPLAAGTQMPMSNLVQRYNITHGLNFMLINLVWRQPIGSRAPSRIALTFRGGAGPTLQHPETTVLHADREQYELGSIGADVAAGIDIMILRHVSCFTDYRVTFARPVSSIAGGTGRMTAVSHQILFGVDLFSIR